MIITPTEHDTPNESCDPAELLIKEARQKARRRRLRISAVLALALAFVVVVVLLVAGGVPSNTKRIAGNKPARTVGANLSSAAIPHFDEPEAIAMSGSHVWIVNMASNSITEFNARTGSLVRVINAKADAFHHPDGAAVQGSHVWVSNGNEEFGMATGNYTAAKYSSVTELNASNGSLVRVINAKTDEFLEPGPIAVSGSHVWVLNANSAQSATSTPVNALIELNASNGSLVHIFKTDVDGLYGPLNLTATHSDVWVTNANGFEDSVTEINATSGALVRVIRSTSGQLVAPDGIAVSGAHVWIANIRDTDNVVTELKASNGSFVRVIKAKADNFRGLFGIAAKGSHVWVTNSGGSDNSVTELNASDGSLVRVIKAKADGFYLPTSIVASGSKLWVLNSNAVTELDASNGSLVRVIK
jgi:DNA-directed RNA polymerase subunit H (RpoH/RPB5)/predicted nucleic acid-binding Zn ribbon protein